jgi:hypothetical protein
MVTGAPMLSPELASAVHREQIKVTWIVATPRSVIQ